MQNWYNQNLGKTHLNPDPPNGIDGECVNAAGSYSMSIGGPQFFGNGDDDTAYTIWQTFNHQFLTRVTSGYKEGDIMFLAPNNSSAGTGPEGHVNVFMASVPGGYRAAEANWNGNRGLAQNNHGFGGVVGAFRPVTNQEEGEDDLMSAKDDLTNTVVTATAQLAQLIGDARKENEKMRQDLLSQGGVIVKQIYDRLDALEKDLKK